MFRADPFPRAPQARAVRSLKGPAPLLAAWAALLRRAVTRWSLGDDERYLRAAEGLEDLERRQRRLERDGLADPGAWLS